MLRKEPFTPNISEVSREPDGPRPPVIITFPPGNTAAHAPLLDDCILPCVTHVPVAVVSCGRYPCRITVIAKTEMGRSTSFDFPEALESLPRFFRYLANFNIERRRFMN